MQKTIFECGKCIDLCKSGVELGHIDIPVMDVPTFHLHILPEFLALNSIVVKLK